MCELLARLADSCRADGVIAYCVGGCVRDRLLGRPSHDVDVALTGAVARAKALAQATRSAFVLLDDGRGTARVVARQAEFTLDLCELHAGDLTADLQRRDYTVNAIACTLDDWLGSAPCWLDPTGGLADLAARRLRLVSAEAVREDPLRVLRGYRLSATLQFDLEPSTRAELREAAPGLTTVAAERILQELLLWLAAPAAAPAVVAAEADGVLAVLLPELTEGAAQRVAALEPWLARAAGRWPQWLAEHDRPAMLRLALLLGSERREPGTAEVSGRLLLSRALRRKLHAYRAPADWWMGGDRLARLALAHHDEAVGAVLRAAAGGELGEAVADKALQDLSEQLLPRLAEPPLVDGNVLQQRLGWRPGPRFAQVLEQARLAQLTGRVKDVDQALALVRKVWENDG